MSDYHTHRLSLDGGQTCVEPSCTSPARHRCKHCHKAYCDMCVRVHKRYVLQEMNDIAKQVYIYISFIIIDCFISSLFRIFRWN